MTTLDPSSPTARKRFPQLAWACAISPVILLLVFITMGIHMRLGLGHWPTPMFESYDAWAFRLHGDILQICLIFVILAAGPLWLVCLLIRPLRPSWPREAVSQLVTYAIGWLLILGTLAFDPTTFSEWILD
jgi:hypothetical protein